jgi:hypothetical protein
LARARAGRALAAWVAAGALCAAAGAAALEREPPAPAEAEILERALDGAAEIPDGLGDDLEAYLISGLIEEGQRVRARERAQALIQAKPRSIGGHATFGASLYAGEGNLALARFHLRRALELFEEDHGLPPTEDSPWRWHLTALILLAMVERDMGHDAEQLEVLEQRDAYYGLRPADRGWALIRLGRYAEARASAEAGLLLDSPDQHSTARNTLCVLEAERLEREASFRRCQEALEHHGDAADADPLFLANAAEAALGVLELDTAERLYLEATRHFAYDTPANPWLELVHLYLAQGRAGESRDAMRSMFAWRARQPAHIDVQTRAAIDLASASLLLAAGHPTEAARLSARGTDRPDRAGRISYSARARRGAAALLDRSANRTAAEWERERASWLPFREAWGARLRALGHALRAWWSGRLARSLVAEERLLIHTVVPYAAGSLVLPEWLQVEVVAVAGAGAIDASLSGALRADAWAEKGGYLAAMRAETSSQRGDHAAALAQARRALAELPRAEVMLRARVAARAAQSALAEGERSEALALFEQALQGDPGVLRRLGIALPCVFGAEGAPLAEEVDRLLRASPRFAEARFGFRLQTVAAPDESVESCLIGPSGTLHACAQVAPEPAELPRDAARRLAAALHARAFAPRVDLTQADLSSLDGSTAELGIRGTDRARRLLSELGKARDPAAPDAPQ